MSEDFLNNDILYFKNLNKKDRDFPCGSMTSENASGSGESDFHGLCSQPLNRRQAYHTNQVYDSIRDFLMEDYAIWNQYKYLYHVKKYQAYFFTVEHTDSQYRQEYLQRFSREFKRAQDLGQLDLDLFSPKDKERLIFIMKEPNRFYRTFYQGSSGKTGLWGRLKSKLKRILGKQ